MERLETLIFSISQIESNEVYTGEIVNKEESRFLELYG